MTIPLDLYVEVTAANGTRYRWDANQAPGSRLQNFSFRTKIGEGFSDAGGQLARRIDQDYPDLNLVDSVTAVGADGSIAYEGRNAAMPRDLSDRHSIGVTLAGWLAHAKDRKFQEIYVDRDMSRWGDMPLAEKSRLAVGGFDGNGAMSFASSGGALTCSIPNQAFPAASQAAVSWYIGPPGTVVSKIMYTGSVTSLPASWVNVMNFSSSDSLVSFSGVVPTLDGTLRTATPSPTHNQYVGIYLLSAATSLTPAAGAQAAYSKLGVYGSSGLATHAGEPGEPEGVYASDVIRDLAHRYCPKLDTSGVQDTNYVIQHLAFADRTFPYDAFLEVNKYHLWHLGVWDHRRLVFRPYDFTDYQWEIRTDEPGVTFSPQGPSTDSLFNGISVTYTDVLSSVVSTVTPADYSTLADPSPQNPWNLHGIDHWDEITLSSPTTLTSALNLGAAALADRNQPKTPGTITVTGYIRDRAGNLQPCWKVRAGDMISVTNFPNDTPRLIVETDYDNETKQNRLAIDRPFALLDAYLDRVGNALGARGLA